MPLLANITPRETILLKTLGRLVGYSALSESMLSVWLEQVRQLPPEDEVAVREIVKVMEWAAAHPHWTSRACNMSSFVFNWQEIYDQYRGDLRKKKLEEAKADSPALMALRQRYPGMLKPSIADAEIKRRYAERAAPVWAKCECKGKYVPSKHPNLRGVPVPCDVCKAELAEIWNAVAAEVNQEVWGNFQGRTRND